ncbi:hypothetical protein [Synechococcus phage S-MS29]|nr:hypothetical protein [Synechococcus phage S-MS29]
MIIRKLKETLGQVFHSPEATGSWEVECAVDEETVDCTELNVFDEKEPYTGVPAPVYLPDDPWFGPATLSEKQVDIKAAHEAAVADNQILAEGDDGVVESPDIHQKMYEIATKGGQTTVQRDPIGGSETFQGGPGGWMSGTGLGQFH